jgi:glycogen(starch) synthase
VKIVVFSNLWPPNFIGGYEIGASQIVRELKRRGHEILLLSAHEYYIERPGLSRHAAHEAASRAEIVDTGLCFFGAVNQFVKKGRLRCLWKVRRTLRARRRYRAAIRAFRPDAFLVFNPLGVLAPVLDDFVACSKQTGAPVTAYVSDHWLAGWPSANPIWAPLSRLRQSPKLPVRLMGRVAAKFMSLIGLLPSGMPLLDRYLYCSQYIRDLSRANSVAIAHHEVVHWGLPNIARVPPPAADHFTSPEPLTLVFAGQVLEHKGLAVLIRALPFCRARHRVVVIGDDQTDYGADCRRTAQRLGVQGQITFAGKKNSGDMLDLLRLAGHVLVVPSSWDEPFSIVVLEGMGVGLPVIASNTGGTAEAITHGETGFLFRRGNSRELAAIIDQLDADRALCRRVGNKARSLVLQKFTMEKMVDQVLSNLVGPAAALPKAA